MALATMYRVGNSRITQLTDAITAAAQIILVADIAAFPAAPNLATIGTENDAEVIFYAGIDAGAGTLTGCLRGRSLTSSRAWPIGTDIYHAWTAETANTMMANIDDTAQSLATFTAQKGAASGLAPLDANTKVPIANLPIVTTSMNGAMTAGDKSKLDGITAGAQVNAVTSVAGRTGAVTVSASDVGLGNVNNTSDADKPISTAAQTALNLKAPLASPTFTGTPAAPTAAATANDTQLANTAFIRAQRAPVALSIATSAWVTSSTYSGYTRQATITLSGLSAIDRVDVALDPASVIIAMAAEMLPATVSQSGSFIVYAKTTPTAVLSGNYTINKGA